MASWLTDEGWDTTLVLAVVPMDGSCVVSERMLVSILSVSMDPCEMLWAETVLNLVMPLPFSWEPGQIWTW